MIIHFLSKIDNEGIKNEIKFSSKVKISQYKEFVIYEFMEPTQKEMNRIEVNKKKINIMAGPSTVKLQLKKKINIVFDHVDIGKLYLITYMHSLQIQENYVHFNYSLFNYQNHEIGNFDISIKITKNQII